MNDNEQKYSSTPYRASGNLNTVIGNPNININSATTSNIMENDSSNVNNFNSSLNQSQNFNHQQNSQPLNSDVSNNSFNNMNFDRKNDDDSSDYGDPVRDFINKTNTSSSAIDNNVNNSNVSNNYHNAYQNTYQNTYSESTASSTTNNTDVRYENVYNARKTKKTKKLEKTKQFLSLVSLKFKESLSIKSIAKEMELSVPTLQRYLIEEIKLSPYQYLFNYRLFAAAKDIISTNKKIKAIALDNGFKTKSHFGYEFKKVLKMSPKQYRKLNSINTR